MHTLSVKDLIDLDTDPQNFWNPNKEEDIDNKLLKLLLHSPETISDFFIIEKVIDETKVGVKMAHKFAELFLKYANTVSEEVPSEIVNSITEEANIYEGLPKDYKHSEETIQYLQYLLIVDDKIKITEGKLKEKEKLVKVIKNSLLFDDGVTSDKKLSVFNTNGKLFNSGIVWTNQTGQVCSGNLTIHINFDHVRLREASEEIIVTNMYEGNILDFPKYYANNKLVILSSLQQQVLSVCAKKIVIQYFVVEKGRKYTFTVKDFLSKEALKTILTECDFVYSNRSFLPYPYLKNNITL